MSLRYLVDARGNAFEARIVEGDDGPEVCSVNGHDALDLALMLASALNAAPAHESLEATLGRHARERLRPHPAKWGPIGLTAADQPATWRYPSE